MTTKESKQTDTADKGFIITAHHGSPGSADDFGAITPLLQSLESVSQLNCIDRATKLQKKLSIPDNNVILGYSWGAKIAIDQVAEAIRSGESPSALILIAPYLYREQKGPSLVNTLVKAPVLGNALLRKMGPKSIDEHIKKSAFPCEVPPELEKLAMQYKTPQRLKLSLAEKNDDNLEENIQLIAKSNLPVLIVAGEKDQIAVYSQQIEKLQRQWPQAKISPLEGAGHGILWTHKQELTQALDQFLSSQNNESKRIGYHSGESQDNNVASFLEQHTRNIGQRKILKWVDQETLKSWDFNINTPLPHQSIEVAQLDDLVSRLGASFKKLGIAPKDRVIIFIPMSLPLYAAMFALQKIGAVAVFLDSWARRDQLGVSAQVASPKAIISVQQAFDYLSGVPEIDQIPLKVIAGPHSGQYDATLEQLMQSQEKQERCPVEQEHTALITFTTGSSGTPKGADRSHRFLCAQHYALNRHIPYTEKDSDLPVFPIFSLNNLAAGVTTVIPAIDVGSPGEKDAIVLIAQMKTEGVTCTTLSPSLMRTLCDYCLSNSVTLEFLRRIVTGGAPVSNDDVRKAKKVAPNAEVQVLYGSTEVEPMAHIEANEMLEQEKSGTDDPEWVDKGVMVGHMDSGLDMRFLKINDGPVEVKSDQDWHNVCVPEGEVGELIVAGEHVCERYFNNEAAFKKSKILDLDGRVWHRTGDLGQVDEKGRLWLVGRVHNAIARGDSYCFPVRSEIIMKKLDFVDKCAYLGLPDSELGQKVAAVYTVKDEFQQKTTDELDAEISRIMQKNEVIVDEIIRVESIPMDPRHHSKVEYAVLRESILKNKEAQV